MEYLFELQNVRYLKKKVVRAASRTFFGKPHFVALGFIFLVLALQNTQNSVLAQFNLMF